MPLSVTTSIDWTGNRNFTSTGDNVTARVLAEGTSISLGLDSARSSDFAAPGACTFALTNESGDYTPENASSPIYPNVLRARPVKVEGTMGGVTYPMFYGRLDDVSLEFNRTRTVQIGCTDGLGELAGVNVSTSLYDGIRAGDAINYLLDAAEWEGGRDIDTGASMFPFWWLDNQDALTALQEIVASEGYPAFAYCDDAGNLIFRDRHYRITRPASRTSQATFAESGGSDSLVSARWSYPFTYNHGRDDIINAVVWDVETRTSDTGWGTVWSAADATLRLADGESQVIYVKASDPFYDAFLPVAGFDYEAIGGTLAITMDRTSGQSVTLVLTASGGNVSVTGLRLRATVVPVRRTTRIARGDGASKRIYGRIEADGSLAPRYCSYQDAGAIADLLIGARAQRLPIIEVTLRGGNDFILGQQLKRAIGDLVTVVNTPAGVNWTGYINRIQHSITGAGADRILTTVFSIERSQSASAGNTFTLNSSLLNGTDVLMVNGYNNPATVLILDDVSSPLNSRVLAF